MANDKVEKMNPVPPFVKFVCANVPMVFDDSLSYYEALCAMWKYLDNVVNVVNNNATITEEQLEAYKKLESFVTNYFDNLNVQEEINNKLDAMVEDGTMSRIILDYLKFPNAADNISYNRLGRKVIARPHYITGTGTYIGLQGGCMDSEHTYVMLQNHVDSSNTLDSEYCKITKIDVRTGEEVDSNTIEIGHGNNIAYDRVEDKYYITSAHGNLDQQAFANKIIKLNSNLTIDSVTDVDKNYDSISVDEEGNLYAGFSYKQSDYAYHIYKLDKETYEELEDIELETTGNTGTGQSICVANNRIVFLNSQPNSIEIFDITGKLLKNYNLKDDEYVIGEAENISTYDGVNFIFGSQNTPDLSCYNFVQLFTTNLCGGTIKDFYRNISNQVNISCHIDVTSDEWNPDGTADKPFYCIDEVSYIIAIKGTNLVFDTTGTYYCAKIEYPKMRFVRGGDSVAVTISCGLRNSLEIYNGSYTMEYVTLPALIIRNSNIYVGGCTLAKSNNEYLCRIQQDSTLTIAGTSFDTSATYSNAFFIADRGIVNWGKNNQNINNVAKEIFRGDNYNFLYATQLWSGTVAKNGTITLNGGNYAPFKMLDITFTDRNHLLWDKNTDGETSRSATFSNLSTAGTGANKIQQVMVSFTDPSIVFYKANEISFDSEGAMTVNTSPTMNIVKIFAR